LNFNLNFSSSYVEVEIESFKRENVSSLIFK